MGSDGQLGRFQDKSRCESGIVSFRTGPDDPHGGAPDQDAARAYDLGAGLQVAQQDNRPQRAVSLPGGKTAGDKGGCRFFRVTVLPDAGHGPHDGFLLLIFFIGIGFNDTGDVQLAVLRDRVNDLCLLDLCQLPPPELDRHLAAPEKSGAAPEFGRDIRYHFLIGDRRIQNQGQDIFIAFQFKRFFCHLPVSCLTQQESVFRLSGQKDISRSGYFR